MIASSSKVLCSNKVRSFTRKSFNSQRAKGEEFDSRRRLLRASGRSSSSSNNNNNNNNNNNGGFTTQIDRGDESDSEREERFKDLFQETFSTVLKANGLTSASSGDAWEEEADERDGRGSLLLDSYLDKEIKKGLVYETIDDDDDDDRKKRKQKNGGGGGSATAAVQQGVVARWSFVAKYGHKQECLTMVMEWVRTIGVRAGLDVDKDVKIISGNIGASESKVELEIRESLRTIADFDEFLQRIDKVGHRNWGLRFAEHVVDGSTKWEILTTHPLSSSVNNMTVDDDDREDDSATISTAKTTTATTTTNKYSRPGVSRTQPRRVLSPKNSSSPSSAGPGSTPINNNRSSSTARPKYEDLPEEELIKYIGKTMPDGRRVVENAFGALMVINPGDVGMF